jgi:drug/metabolite transporter (DMT)-like permease
MSTDAELTARPPSLIFPVAFGALAIGAVAMGASPVFVRHAEVGPFASAFWRVATALPALLAWAAIEARRNGRSLSLRLPAPILWSGIFFAGDLAFWHLAILNTTMANATLMACLAPVWVLFLSGLVIGEKVGPRSFVGLAICLCGATLLIGSSYRLDPARLIGDFYGLVTSLFFGLYFLAVRFGRRTMAGGELTLMSSLVTTVILFGVALVSGNDLLPASAKGYAALGALGLISHAGGQGLLAVALGSLSAAFSSLVIFIEAVAAALFGWLLFDEGLAPLQIFGAVAILAGIIVARPADSGGAPR